VSAPSPSATTPDQDRLIQAELVRLLYRNLPSALGAVVVIVVLIGVVFWDVVDRTWLLLWCAAMLTVLAVRLVLCVQYQRLDSDSGAEAHWRRLAVIGSAGGSLLWAASTAVLFPPDSIGHQYFLCLIAAGLGAAATVSLNPVPAVFRVYLVGHTTPLAVQFLLLGDARSVMIGVAVLCFTVGMLIIAHNLHHSLVETLRLRFEKSALIQGLEQARDAAEQANRAKSDFLSNMSHELRTPLNAVLGFSQLLLFERGDPLTPAQREAITSIERTGRHLLALVEDILDVSRIENRTIELATDELSPGELCQQAAALMQPDAVARGVALVVLPGAGEPPSVSGNRKRALQVLTNFLSNALKYGSNGGRVEIGAVGTAAGGVRFTVTDFGPGISSERQAELFRPFSRAGLERTNIEGTGIGLSIAKGLVEQMGGLVGVDSSPGRGATFWFTLPGPNGNARLAPQPAPPPVAAKPDGPVTHDLDQVGAAKILYVEDMPENRTLVRRLLARYSNIAYLEADSAEAGIEVARRERPDVILMDMRLPGMTGLEALKILRADAATGAIAVIGLTGAAMPHEAAAINAAGFDGYITKPFRIPTLLAKLAAVLGQRSPR
jgi:signal transduction histidine kinase/ActR/RegA family two-component response regulator